MEETLVQFLGLEDPLEEELATHSSILSQELLWTEEPGELQSTGSQKARQSLVTKQQSSLALPSLHVIYSPHPHRRYCEAYISGKLLQGGIHKHSLVFIFIYLFLVVRSLLLCGFYLVAVSRDHSLLQCLGFSLQWALLLQNMVSVV